eukprot:c9011_g1_i2.p1 GENE.c9011_g1_i2~~c9011_g1_i2.p1  ORF type:complete len:426 (-),score=101.37 c9011_g1_i2:107-1384(-)
MIQDTRKRGVVPLDGNWSVESVNLPHKKFPFVIANPYGGRSYYCDALTNENRDEWIKAILQVIAILGSQNIFDDTNGPLDVSIPESKSVVGLSDFELKKVLGRGSFGKVMLVGHKGTGKLFAMKVLRKEAIIAGNQVAHTKTERSVLQELNHPFIVNLHYAFQTAGKLYLLLDYVRGGELFFQLKREGVFSEARVRLYIAEIILALEYMHERSIVYRDLKPENILLDVDGHIVLTDFGLSKEAVSSINGARTVCGTPEYLAPEILLGFGHGTAVDWWSLGTLMYEMLGGLPPFYAKNRQAMFDKILTAPLSFPPSFSRAARDLLIGLLEREPEMRLGSKGANEIRSHPFFSGMDWDMVMAKGYQPEYVPVVLSEHDTTNFDPQYTQLSVVDSVVAESELNAIASNRTFEGFTYIAQNDRVRLSYD